LLSTSVPGTSVATHQTHDLVRRQAPGSPAAHVLDDVAPRRTTARCLALGEAGGVTVNSEVNFGAGDETEGLAYV
jgi:hypothetical protein